MQNSVINCSDKQPNSKEMALNVKDRWLCVVCVDGPVMSVGVEKRPLCLFNCWATQQCSQISCRRQTEILHINGVCKLVWQCLKFSATTNCQWFIYCLKHTKIWRLNYKKTVEVFVEALVLSHGTERMSYLLLDPQDASEPQTYCGHGQQWWLTNGQRKKERERMKDSKRERNGHDFASSWRKSSDVWSWRCLWTCTDSNSVLCGLQLASSGINTYTQTFPNVSPLSKTIDWLHFVFHGK